MLAIEASGTRILGLAELLERFGHGLLRGRVKRARDGHIEAVELIEAGDAQLLGETSAYGAGGLMAPRRGWFFPAGHGGARNLANPGPVCARRPGDNPPCPLERIS